MSKKKIKSTSPAKKSKRPAGEAPYIPREDIQRLALEVFEKSEGRVLTYKQVCYVFGKTTMAQKRVIYQALTDLASRGVLQELESGRFVLASKNGQQLEGVFDYRGGRPSFIPDDSGIDPIPLSGQALHGDRVLVSFVRNRRGEYKRLQVTEILERREATYVGRLQITRGYAFFIAPNKELRQDVFIPEDKLKGATQRDKVLVRILGWDKRSKNPRGEVVDVLGQAGDNTTEMHAILAEFGLPYSYPEDVECYAETLRGEITAEELAGRDDFRGVLTCTIDPKDAKDFDDALSFRELSQGEYEVGVHIADVSHYVPVGGIIDQEAYRRATSVYLVDRTIPMLPERLSNFLCSLRPDEDKYAYSCVFVLDAEAKVRSARITRSVIRSQCRFTYEEAQDIIETGSGKHAEAILILHRLAQKLRTKRFEKGSIAFDRPEVRFELDETGKPLSVIIKESKAAHQLIEEFMLIANRTVAESVGKRSGSRAAKKTFVYRIHEQPDAEKMETFATFVRRFGYKLKTDGSKNEITRSINRLLDDAKGRPEENLIETLAVRSMQKARYSTENIGHYGLAFAYYSHFTSPIRRYPDMMAHRLLVRYADGGRSVSKVACEEECDHCSQMEQLAANAERASIKYKQVEFMSDKIGQVFDGVISGVTEWGLYVELNDNKCEGLVPMRDLDDDFYEFDEANYALVGRRRHRTYRLGDPITITVEHANLERKQLDFRLA